MSAKRYQTILVGVDGSRQAHRALQKAVAIAVRNQARLCIATVMNGGQFVGLGATEIGFGYVDQKAMDEVRANMATLVSRYADQAREAGVTKVETSVLYGSPKTILAHDLPEEKQADLIIVGATGANVVERMFLGSTASYITTHAVSDVLIVRTGLDNRPLHRQPVTD
ncbi:universal stress protein [Levilactobacillus bambusae]|uniref:Universal stress protein n=1 Tax=Levilactobacillus bambusae TaxID=2024736 RepID=A0A2V1N2D8_9LACO|nr:universal stress protein [Levilactobacillus bambusae]PWG01083.1 universal stress protein [Levilactobacillus bambusae]